MKIWAVAGNQSGFSLYKWIDFPNTHYFQCRKGMVVQLGLSGKRLGSPADWTRKANYHRETCGAPCSFLLFPLSSWVFVSVLVQLWMFSLYLSPTRLFPGPDWYSGSRAQWWSQSLQGGVGFEYLSPECVFWTLITQSWHSKHHQMTSVSLPQTLRKN